MFGTLNIAILQTLINWDTSLSLAINGMHCPYFDNFMMMYTGRWIWIPLYLSLLVVMLRNFPLRVNVVCIVVSVLLVTMNDQLASTFIRPALCRLRPANLENPIAPLVHIVDGYRGGRYGFPSAHAANCWGAAFFVLYVFRRRVLSFCFMLWALVMCWSRVYLGVHYVGDIVVGALVGFVDASFIYCIFRRMMRRTAESFIPTSDSPKLYTPCVVCAVEVVVMLVLAGFTRFSF